MHRFRHPLSQKAFILQVLLVFSHGAVGTDIRTECTNDKIRLSHPQLADPIQEKSYKELIWTVDDPEKQGQDKQKLVYCNEYFKCHKYNITGRYQQRIETTAAVRGVLYIKQKKFNDKLTYTCRVIHKGNKPPCDYTITVSSSANCLSTTVGKSIDLSRPIHGKFSKNDMEDISWYRILQDGGKEKIAHCSPSRVLCTLINCTRSCPEYLTRLKTDGLSVILTKVTPNDRGLRFQCELHPIGIQRAPRVYIIRVRDVALPRPAVDGSTSPSIKTAQPTRANARSYTMNNSWQAPVLNVSVIWVIIQFMISVCSMP
nr:uncharacterized protein LOC131780602 isoform X2 [Pocillopora verrucosa]